MTTTRHLILAAATLSFALVACNGSSDNADIATRPGVSLDEPSRSQDEPPAPTAASVAVTTTESTGPIASTVEPESTPAVTDATSPDPAPETTLATTMVDVISGTVTVPVRIDIMKLDRGSDRVTLAFKVTNTSEADEWSVGSSFNESVSNSVNGVSLIDLANNQRFLVLIDSEGSCVCSETSNGTLGPGASVDYNATFPAPPPEVTKVDVQMGGVAVLPDVTIVDR